MAGLRSNRKASGFGGSGLIIATHRCLTAANVKRHSQAMRVLVIYCHPCADSYSAALRNSVTEGLAAAGHTIEVRDLYAEGFDPVLSSGQRRAYFTSDSNALDLTDHVVALRSCDGLVLVYPTWWFGMPAMLKGWFDRVWLPDVAFRLGGPMALQPLLTRLRRIGVVTTYGSPRWLLWWVG